MRRLKAVLRELARDGKCGSAGAEDMRTVSRVGRKFAGCELDGREHKEFPKENKS